MTREPSGCSLCLNEENSEPRPPQAPVLLPEGAITLSAPSHPRGDHLSEETGRPSFCHLAWGSGEVSSRQKSRTKCPRAACTKAGSEPAKLILGSGGEDLH